MLKNSKSTLNRAITMLLILMVMIVTVMPNSSVKALANTGISTAPLGNENLTVSTTIAYQNGIDVITFTDQQGGLGRVAVKQFSDTLYFWYIENNNDLANLLASPEVLALHPPSSLQSISNFNTGAQLDVNLQPVGAIGDLGISVEPDSVIVSGRVGLPKGGWVKWANGKITVYISHNLAAYWVAGAGIAALICAVVAVIPYGLVPGTLCFTVWGLSGIVIAYYDSAGNPGFYINATASKVWITP